MPRATHPGQQVHFNLITVTLTAYNKNAYCAHFSDDAICFHMTYIFNSKVKLLDTIKDYV